MKANTEASDTPSLRVRYLRAFGRDEEGGIIVLTLLLLVIMLVMGGMAVDFMRYESRRVLLQSVSDRAVLAAAELDQTLDSEEVVLDYFRAAGLEDTIVGSPIVEDTDGSRSVTVRSELDMNTFYLRLIGIDQLEAPAQSAAIEGVGSVEISLILDISGSMGGNVGGKTKMNRLKEAASDFVDEILDPDYEDEISMSLVAYSQHVNIGDGLFGALTTTPDSILIDGTIIDSSTPGFNTIPEEHRVTNEARCVDFNQEEYATTVFDAGRTYQQVETFDHSSNGWNLRYPLCPTETQGGMIPLSQNAEQLKDAIDDMQPTTTTAVHLGMKWGVSLLDPSMRDVLANVDEVDPAFAGLRPLNHKRNSAVLNSVKYIVLMTDGANVAGRRAQQWALDDFYLRRGMNNNSYEYWWYNINDHPDNLRPGWNQMSYYPTTAELQDTWLQQSCEAAKAEEIIVFTIAMGAGDHGENQMRQCATSANHYFETQGKAIDQIFEAIADQITSLRLSL